MRFARFNVVGALGFALQLAVLGALGRMGWPVALATLAAVEAAVLHNFAWHERWTWSDRREGSVAARLARFHLVNGVLSLAGNLTATLALVGLGVPLLAANAVAVALCAILTFMTADRLVFRAG